MALTLIFVYNIDSGLFNALTDAAHKMLSPGTYPSSSRMPSYGAIGEKLEWKQFITQLGIPVEFHIGNQFQKQYGAEITIPSVFLKMDEELKLLAPSKEISSCTSLGELKQLIEAGLDSLA